MDGLGNSKHNSETQQRTVKPEKSRKKCRKKHAIFAQIGVSVQIGVPPPAETTRILSICFHP